MSSQRPSKTSTPETSEDLSGSPRTQWRPTFGQILRAARRIISDSFAVRSAHRDPIQYASAGQDISGTVYYPPNENPAPAVLILHTATGLTPHEQAIAAQLAKQGYLSLVIAYSKRTTGAVIEDEENRKRMEQIVEDGLRYLQGHPRAIPDRIAVMGFSLGGYLAMHLATAESSNAPRAAVVYYGIYAFPESALSRLRTPLLAFQGRKDTAFFVTNALKLEQQSNLLKQSCELVMYEEAGHQFDLFDPGSVATRDAWSRTIQFLDQHIGDASSD